MDVWTRLKPIWMFSVCPVLSGYIRNERYSNNIQHLDCEELDSLISAQLKVSISQKEAIYQKLRHT